MRFLFTLQPMFGHFHAMAPLAQALMLHGHEVAFATGKGFGPTVQRCGFLHFPCGFDFDGSKDIFEVLPGWEAIKRLPLSPGEQQLYGFIQELGPQMADDLIALMKNTWRPDVVVRDPLDFGGYIAAERYGLPHAAVLWAFYISAKLGCAEAVADLRRRYGLPSDPRLDTLDRYLILHFLPASWAFPDWPVPPVTHRFCSPPFDRSSDAGLPEWVDSLADQPTVYATLGTTFNQSPGTFRAILDAFSDGGINLIVTVGRSMDPAQFQPLPDHIKMEQYIPQSLILPRCDAMIFHGGYNSLLSALWHGLPMVVMPMGAGDQQPTAMRCAEVGAGALVEGDPPQPEAILAATKSVLGPSTYRARARQLQREIKELPSLSEAVCRLEVLAKDHQPQRDDA